MIYNYFKDCCDHCKHADIDYDTTDNLTEKNIFIYCPHMNVCANYKTCTSETATEKY